MKADTILIGMDMRRFNGVLSAIDFLTGYRYEHVTDIRELLDYLDKEFGRGCVYVEELAKYAKRVGYDIN